MAIPTMRRPLHEVIPPLVLGTATFNTQYVPDPFDLPAAAIVSRALDLGVTAFDTSPYYGPSEEILGAALRHPSVTNRHDRSSYFLITKTGRVAADEFDYSAPWVRQSVRRSLARLGTEHLDLVYAHDVEFVSPAEVLTAVRELRRLRDEDSVVRYVGISGYPVSKLCELAELVLAETGEPLDAVLSYGHFTIQNTTLGQDDAVSRLSAAGVGVVLNASMLGMGLLTTRGADSKQFAAWHPSPEGLRSACQDLVPVAVGAEEKLEVVAIRWALDNWSRDGAARGTSFLSSSSPPPPSAASHPPARIGVSVMGISSIPELEETARVFNSVIEGMGFPPFTNPEQQPQQDISEAELGRRRAWSLERRDKIQCVVEAMWAVLGEWKDYSWASPDPGFVNKRKVQPEGHVELLPTAIEQSRHAHQEVEKNEPLVCLNVEEISAS